MGAEYGEISMNRIYQGDSAEILSVLPSSFVDLTVTSPPYDNLRSYHGYSFDFETIARQLFRVTKPGGVVVWIVADATEDASETGTSFKQALFFREVGFRLHDTMIWEKDTFSFPQAKRYHQVHEYMFVLSKGSPKTFNAIEDRTNKYSGAIIHGTSRKVSGTTYRKSNHNKTLVKPVGARFNVWHLPSEKSNKTGHPAPFPLKLATDHIISWSNPGDIILDPFLGSGTTALAARDAGRKYIGIDTSPEYVAIARARLLQKNGTLPL